MSQSPYDDLKIRISVIAKGDRGHAENKKITWGRLKERLGNPHVDNKFTLEEYLEQPIDVQNKRKDVGSFVGGTFRDGLRKNNYLDQRSIVTLDIDSANARQIDLLKEGISDVCQYEFFGSTTRKHRKKKPRWRLVFPLSRPLEIEEYAPLSRILASMVFNTVSESMDAVDDVSYRPAQVMYWPSVCKDALFEVIDNRGELLDPDKFLDSVDYDWRDWTLLPYSEARGQKRPTTGKKAEDPREKSGMVGAFCRAYDVEDAIETYLSDKYVLGDPNSSKPRYTYTLGSSSNGAIVEDDGLFLYSHHGTDPCAERLVNAFDLVRIHLFGELDESAPEDASATELPSYREMIRLCKDDDKVQEQLTDDLGFNDLGGVDDTDVVDLKSKKAKDPKKKPVEAEDEDEGEETPEQPRDGPDLAILRQSALPAPDFPVDILGPFWAERVGIWAKNSSAPIDYTAMPLLAAAGTLIGNSRWVKAKEGWTEPPVLWCALVGRPSSNKSPALGNITRILDELEAERRPEYADALRMWETEKKKAAIRRKIWEEQVAAAQKSGDDTDDMPANCAEPPKPGMYRCKVGDITLEKLMLVHSQNPRGLLNLRDEMNGWFANMSRYNTGSDRPAWLEAFGGRSYSIDRVKHEDKPVFVPRFSVGIIGGLQPDRLAEVLSSPDDGLQARFCYVWPETKPLPIQDGIEEDTGAEEALRKLSRLHLDISDTGVPRPDIIQLSKKAWTRFRDWADQHARNDVFELPGVEAAFGKANGLVLRLALILEFLWWSEGMFEDNPEPGRVSLKAINAAIRLRDEYIVPMQRRAFSHTGRSSQSNAKRVALWIVKNKIETFSTTDIFKADILPDINHKGGALKVSEAVEFLLSRGWFEPMETKTGKRGRPTRMYKVNERVHEAALDE